MAPPARVHDTFGGATWGVRLSWHGLPARGRVPAASAGGVKQRARRRVARRRTAATGWKPVPGKATPAESVMHPAGGAEERSSKALPPPTGLAFALPATPRLTSWATFC